MKIRYLLYVVIGITFFGCTPQNAVVITDIVTEPSAPTTHFQKALDNVLDIVATTNPTKYQMLSNKRMNLSAEYYTSQTLAGQVTQHPTNGPKYAHIQQSSIDTLLYVVNFGNDQGFAIMSANEELFGDMIFAIADSGSISMNDFVETEGIDYTLQPSKAIGSMIDGYIGGITDLHKKK